MINKFTYKNLLFKNNIFNKKNLIIILILFLFLIIILSFSSFISSAKDGSSSAELEQNIDDQIDKINFKEIDEIIENVNDYEIFSNSTFKEKVKQLLSGNYFTNYDNLFDAIINIIFKEIKNIIPILCSIIAICILSNIITSIKSEGSNVDEIINFVCYSVIVIILASNIVSIIKLTNETVNILNNQMSILFPIILTLLVSMGSVVSVSIFKPIVLILTNVVVFLFNNFLIPILTLMFILTIISGLSKNIKVSKLSNLLLSIFKWSIGIIFTLFSGFLTIQGISAGKYDSISIKTAKFTIKSYIPIIGGYLSDGLDLVVLGSILIKNAIGVAGLLLLFITILSPIFQILIFKFGLQLVSGILETINNDRLSNIVNDCSKILIMPIILILSVSFMYFISLALFICTANVV